MNSKPHISVVIGTFNRCAMLREALVHLASQQGDLNYEIIVVDNNSTDETEQVVASFVEGGHANIRYLFEEQQGVAYARNAGVQAARSDIVAFTDDDIQPEAGWLAAIKRRFDQHPEIELVGGKVLPRWDRTPPKWLTIDHWSPLGILDFGDESFYLDAQRPLSAVTGNLAVYKSVFEQLGGFRPEFQRVKDGIGSTEDHEFLLRFYALGKRGLYAPDVKVIAPVEASRLTKAYHRRWHDGHGRFSALMGYEPLPADAPRLFGVPGYFYRRLVSLTGHWLRESVGAREAKAFWYESEIRYTIQYIRVLAQQAVKGTSRSAVAEIAHFLSAHMRRKLSSSRPPSQPHDPR